MKTARVLVAILAVSMAASAVRAETIPELFKRVSGSVVVVRAVERVASDRPGMVSTADTEVGSGVLIDSDRVLTAAHVVQVAESISVEVGGETLSARILSSEPGADLAVLQLERKPMKAVPAALGDSSTVQVGDEVIVVGAPLGMSYTLSVGHVSGRRTARTTFGGFAGMGAAEMLQTDASINPGNSGGPMFDMSGNVIGIVSHIIFGEAGAGGLGFVVTSNLAKELVLSGGNFWSGMEGYALDGELARIFQLPQPRGILVQRVAQGSPAEKIGLIPGNRRATIGEESFLVGGDVILEVQGIEVSTPDSATRIRAALQGRSAQSPLRAVVMRGGRRVELEWIPSK